MSYSDPRTSRFREVLVDRHLREHRLIGDQIGLYPLKVEIEPAWPDLGIAGLHPDIPRRGQSDPEIRRFEKSPCGFLSGSGRQRFGCKLNCRVT